jgi:hypothetical protein
MKVFISAMLVASVHAACDNQCSGHGTCGKNGVCECFDNWGLGLSHDSGDCSDRICPYDFAWVDNPDSKGRFHKYSECSGQGLCARGTGNANDNYQSFAHELLHFSRHEIFLFLW